MQDNHKTQRIMIAKLEFNTLTHYFNLFEWSYYTAKLELRFWQYMDNNMRKFLCKIEIGIELEKQFKASN